MKATRGETIPHVIVLAVCLAMLTAAAILQPPSADRGRGVTLGGKTLPDVCLMKQSVGLECPGCGLTRSWVSAIHGQFRASFQFHRLGWLLLLYAMAQALRHGLWLGLPRLRDRLKTPGRLLDRGLIPAAALLLVNWLYNLWV